MEYVYYLIFFILIAIGSTVLHELAHAFVAYKLGDDTAKLSGRLSLNPFRHIDPVMSVLLPLMLAMMGMPILGGARPVPINTQRLKGGEWGFALVALAGPLTNFILSFVFFLIGFWATGTVQMGSWPLFAYLGVYLNFGYMLFNLIPIPPLDGSRILYVFAPEFAREFMHKIERYGFLVIYAMLWLAGNFMVQYFVWAQTGILSLFRAIVGA